MNHKHVFIIIEVINVCTVFQSSITCHVVFGVQNNGVKSTYPPHRCCGHVTKNLERTISPHVCALYLFNIS